MTIHEASCGQNVVVETDGVIYIGRLGKSAANAEVRLHDCAVHPVSPGENTEGFVRQTAKYGVAVDYRDVTFPTNKVMRVRMLGLVPKD